MQLIQLFKTCKYVQLSAADPHAAKHCIQYVVKSALVLTLFSGVRLPVHIRGHPVHRHLRAQHHAGAGRNGDQLPMRPGKMIPNTESQRNDPYYVN
jgi:hypothetical protein